MFIGAEIPMKDRLAMVDMFEPYAHLFEGAVAVDYNRHMRTTLGKANITKQNIKLNVGLLSKHPNEMLPTFAHELAHLLTYKFHTHGGIKAHGKEWKQIMVKLGHEPTRTHDLDVSDVKRRWTRVAVTCNCKTHMVTKHQIKKMENGSRYYCVKCNGYLKI